MSSKLVIALSGNLFKYVFVLTFCNLQFQSMLVASQESAIFPHSLRTCCSFQSQYNVDERGCEDLKTDHVPFPTNFSVPTFLSMFAYSENLAKQVKFSLAQSTASQPCSSDQFTITTSLDSALKDGFESINFTIEGYLKFGKDYFAPNEYCINTLNQTTISIVVCSSNQNCSFTEEPKEGSRPCIRRCCEFGQVYDLSGLTMVPKQSIKCKPSGNKQWSPILYGSDPYKPLDEEQSQELQPHFIASHPRDGWCDPSNAVILSLSSKYEHKKEIIRILQDGTFMRKIQAQTWKKMDKQYFCIDGGQNYPDLFDVQNPGFYTGDREDTVILDCTPGYKDDSGIANVSNIYGISMIVSAVFLVLTVLVYLLLWEKQNIHGWTILCYVVSLLLWYVFMVMMHFSRQLNLTQGSNGQGGGTTCRVIGASIHFLFISTFCWLTMINFDLWWTFNIVNMEQVLKPTTGKSKGLKRFIFYMIFAFGIPIIIVSVALSLDFRYRDDIESDVIIPLYGQSRCYMNPGIPMLAYLYGPIGILLGMNFLFFIFTMYSMYKIQQSTKFASTSSSKNASKQNQSVKLFLKLFIIMGVTWIFEVISWYVSGYSAAWYWTVLDLFNIFQAIFIFIIFVCKKETISSLEQKYPSFKHFTNSVKMESTTFERVINRFPKLKGILTPFRKERKRNEATNSSNPTDLTSMSMSEVPDAAIEPKFEMTPKAKGGR